MFVEGTAKDTRAWAFALVHGIGTTQSLPMIREVSEALRGSRPSLALTPEAEIHEVMDEGAPRYSHIRRGRYSGGEARMGTVHWADVTYYRQGLISAIGILLMAVFGVRFFASVAAQHTKPTPILVRIFSVPLELLLHLMVGILALAVFPVTFVALIYSCVALLAEYIVRYHDSMTPYYQALAIAIGGMTACLLLARVGIHRVKGMKERTLGIWIFGFMGGFAILIGGLILAERFFADLQIGDMLRISLVKFVETFLNHRDLSARISHTDGIGVMFALMHILQVVFGIVVLTLICGIVVLLLVYYLASVATGRRWHTMVFAVVSVASIWIVLTVMLWPENLTTHAAISRYAKLERPGVTSSATPVDKCVDVTTIRSAWPPFVDTQVKRNAQSNAKCDGLFERSRTLDDLYPMVWFEAVLIVFLMLFLCVIGFVFCARLVWINMQTGKQLDDFKPATGKKHPLKTSWPRLIVAKSYVTLVLMFIITAATVFVLRAVKGLDDRLLDYSVPHEASVGAEYVRLAVVIFIVMFALFATLIVDGLKLVLDVVNHFVKPPEYPVRNKIRRRFEEMIGHLVEAGDKPNLVIIAHSQGTVITIDALLRSDWVEATLEKVSTLTIMTFGSPFTHVYQRYFPREYSELSDTSLAALAQNPRIRWINAYRIDDYVGTYIENSIPNFPENIPLPKGGHTRYWEAEVMNEVLSHPKLKDFLLVCPVLSPGRSDVSPPDLFPAATWRGSPV